MKELNLNFARTFPKELKEMMRTPDVKIKEKPFYDRFLNKNKKKKR